MIRIAYVIPTLDQSGAERQLSLLAAGLPRDRFAPHVIALTRGGPYEDFLREHDVPVEVVGKRWRLDPFAWRGLRRSLRAINPDLVHSFLFAANAYSRLGVTRGAARIVVSERCVDSWKAGWQLMLDRRLASRTDRLLANSNAVAEFYLQQGIASELVDVIPNGVVDHGQATGADRDRLRQQLEVPADAKLVVYCGRLARQKRVDDLVFAFHLLRQTLANCYLVICGDGPELPRVEQRIHHFDLGGLVKTLGHREDGADVVRACDAFWLASDFEGMSNSLCEAMVAGVPSVATRIGPNEELIEHGRSGYLVNVGDTAGFQQFTLDLLTDAALSANIGSAARERMQQQFSVDRMIAAHVALYEQLTGKAATCAV